MATLQKIRNNAGILISIFIGFALLAFIMGDLFKPGSSMFGNSSTEVAEIAGKSIPVQLFQQKIDENVENYKRNYGQSSLDENTMNTVQSQTWEQMVRNYVMEDEFAELGIDVSGDELFDMVQGNNIHPQIMQVPIFRNKETGIFDRSLVIQFLKNMELDPTGQAQSNWAAFEKSLAEEQKNAKYNTLIEKGLYITSLEVKERYQEKNLKTSFDYLLLNYTMVADSSVEFSTTDLKKYYDKYIERYKQEEEFEINYVTFPVVASEQDDSETREKVSELIEEFKVIDNVEQYVNLNSDEKFNSSYFSKEELPAAIDSLFEQPIGTVVGPYKENNAYKIARVVDFKELPDSVKASHILISPENKTLEEANGLADSLIQEIRKGGSFVELAKKYSADGSAEQGGDLGWFTQGTMVKPFSDACFFGKKGDVVSVQTQFGIHVIKIEDQGKKTKKEQIAILSRKIEAGSRTFQQIYSQASQFGSANRTLEKFVAAAEKENLNLRFAKFGRNEQRVANLENPRAMVRWAFSNKVGDVSEIFEFGDIYVIAALKKHLKEGKTPFEEVKLDIEREVKREKKANYLASKIEEAKKGASTLQTVASNLSVEMKECSNAEFSVYSLPGLGFEPQVQGTMFAIEKNKISTPIEGVKGVFLVEVRDRETPFEEADIQREKTYLQSLIVAKVRYEVFNAIKKASNIEDNRSKFY